MTTLPISKITLGDRVRKDLGDVAALAASIKEIGLLHPIVLREGNFLIAGARRLAAVKSLGWKEVPVRTVDTLNDAVKCLLAERDENTCRKDFLPSEAVVMARTLEEIEAPKAAAKKKAGKSEDGKAGGRGKKNLPNNLRKVSDGETRVKVARDVGMSHPQLKKAAFVVESAKADPDLLEVQERMDRTGNVDRCFKIAKSKIEKKKREAEAAELPHTANIVHGDLLEAGKELPDNSVDLILTDPPYLKNTLDAYDKLALFAAAKLKPGGLLLTYAGHCFIPEVIAALGCQLEYWWTFCCHHQGAVTRLQKLNLNVGWKPIFAYAKPPLACWWEPFSDTVGTGREKGDHDWQQAVGESETLIKNLSPKGGLIVDPFCGSGTVLLAAKNSGRKFWGCDIDATAVATARVRVYGND